MWQGKAVPGGAGAGFFCGAAGIHEIAGNAVVHEKHALAGNAFAIERGTELVWMIDVVGNGDVFSKEQLAGAAGEAGGRRLGGGGGEIEKEKPDGRGTGGGREG